MPDVLSKFNSYQSDLLAAVEGNADLRANRRLYKKLHKFYKSEGVIFTGDTEVDYNIVVNYLTDDLFSETY